MRRRILAWSVGALVVVGAVLIWLWGGSAEAFALPARIALSLGVLLGGAVVLSQRIEKLIDEVHGDLVSRTWTMIETLSTKPEERVDSPRALAVAVEALTTRLSNELAHLEEERDWLEGILENGMEGVLVTDASGRIILANRALRTMARTHGEIEGKLPIEAIRNDDFGLLLRRVQSQGKPMIGEIDLGTLDARHVRVHAAPLLPSRGVVAMLYDVTDLRRLETMRRDFVANVSHELRTPIAAIRAAVETLEGGALDDPAIALDFLGIISRHAERLHALVEDLLDLSKLDARRHEIEIRPLSVGDAMASTLELFRHAAERKGITLKLADVPENLVVQADARAVDRILANFIDNAIKYCREGDTITLTATPTHAMPRALVAGPVEAVETTSGEVISPDAVVRLSVRDTGPGIEASHIPRLFERFYRAQKGRSRDSGGTGLGLAIAKHLAEAMGGSVSAESEVGKGSMFSLDLRVGLDEAAPGPRPSGVVEAA
ncbi:MAG: ATP-binding protein [Polyangiaceae bacterium]